MKSAEASEISAALEGPGKMILLHSNADLDAVGSAVALFLRFGDAELCAPDGISHLGKRFLENLGIRYNSEITGGKPVVVDAHDEASLGYGEIDWNSAIIIDHHTIDGEPICRMAYIDQDKNSTCEMIWEILDRPAILEKDIGLALMAGILADTSHLRRGNHDTLLYSSEILRAGGIELEELAPFFEKSDSQDMSRRISRLKGAQRVRFDRIGDWLIAKSEVGAFEGAVCHGLLALGADIALVGSQKDEEFRVTGRATRETISRGIHLGRMMNDLAQEIGGQGGGHDGAAGFTGQGDVEAMLNICSERCVDTLRKNR